MNKPLAVFTPQIGTFSETFVRRHTNDLLPNGTVVVTGNTNKPFAGNWSSNSPTLVLNQIDRKLHQRAITIAKRRLGLPISDAIVKRFLLQNKTRVILSEYLDFSLSWLPVAQQLGIKFVAHAHGYDVSVRLRDPYWQSEYLKYSKAAAIVTVSQLSRERLIKLGLEPSQVYVIPCGVDIPNESVKRIEGKTIRLLAVGRMVPKKAPILLLDAFRRAVEICPNLELDYIGDGTLLPAVKQFILAFGLKEKVILHGEQPSQIVQKFMTEADIFVQHSITEPDTGDEEGLPVGILEGMAQALPVVATKHAGIPEAVLEEKTGFLVDEGDSLKMSKYILLLAENLELRRQMGFAGWERARNFFSWEREKTSLLKLMELA